MMSIWRKKYGAIVLMFISTLFASTAQIMWKYGLMQKDLINHVFILGFIVYLCGGLLMVMAFRRGELSVLYPILATSYVWVSLLSPYFFGEEMNLLKWSGVVIILFSVSLLGFGCTHKAGKHEVHQHD